MAKDLLAHNRSMREVKTGSLTLLVCAALYIEIDPRVWNDVCQLLVGFVVGPN